MRLISMETVGIAGLPDRLFRFSDAEGKPVSTLVVGRSGKTTLLRTVALLKEMVGPYAAPPGQRFRRLFVTPESRVHSVWALAAGERTQLTFDADWNPSRCEQRIREQFAQRAARGFALLGSPRIQTGASPEEDAYAVASDGSERLYDAALACMAELSRADRDAIVRRLGEAGFVTALERPDSLTPIKTRIAERLPEVRLLSIKETALGVCAEFVHKSGVRLDLRQLSRDERDVVLSAVTLAALEISQGLLLVDDAFDLVRDEELEAHWGWLHRISAGSQIIATSRSPRRMNPTPNIIAMEAP